MTESNETLKSFDPLLAQAIADEEIRQEQHLELIASENYTSKYVLEAQGSILTNKYAEGYPGKRYYGGCEFVDIVEQLAIDRAKELFGCGFVNVQPHSGSQANAAVFHALLRPGDIFLGMDLSNGGHLTHGSKVNFSGANYQAIPYTITAQGLIDYDQLEDLAQEHKPKLILGGFSAYSQKVDWKRMREIANKVGAYLFVDMAHVAGLVVAGLYPDPVPHAHVVTTTTHKTLGGPRGGVIISNANDETLYKKLNSAVFPGIQGGPLMHVIAGKAVAFLEALQPAFKELQQRTLANSQAMVEVFIKRGYKIVSNGTMNHLFLVDLIDTGITGKAADSILSAANITVNKNSVPNDPQSPFITSGIRIGTPAMSRRGMNEEDAKNIASMICDLLDAKGDSDVIRSVKNSILELCARYPVYTKKD